MSSGQQNKRISRKSWGILYFSLALLFSTSLSAENYPIVSMDNLNIQELRMKPFELLEDSRVEISIVGARNKDSDQLFSLGWILDADSREVVWSMSEASTRRILDEKKLRQFEGGIYLDKGRYEAYYFAGNPLIYLDVIKEKLDLEDLGDVIGYIGDVFDEEFRDNPQVYSEMTQKYHFEISSSKQNFKKLDYNVPQLDNTFLSIVRPRNLSDEKRGFIIKQKMPIIIYAFGEYTESNDIFVDGAKIINAQTRDKVWAMERWNTDWLGGAIKNRCFHKEVTLPPGEYILHYWSDDSHTFDAWNATPPYDPFFWGVTLATTNAADLTKVSESDIEKRKQVLVQIVKVGDDANYVRPFEVKQDIRAVVYAIGEGRSGMMYDFGWIENTETEQNVWVMKEEKTDHAGGAYKNRVFDGVIDLPRGKYKLHYKSDGSHSYQSWNAAPPSDSRHYGITLFTYGETVSENAVVVGELENLAPTKISIKEQHYYQGSIQIIDEELEELHLELAELSGELAQLQYEFGEEKMKIGKDNYAEMKQLESKYKQERKELLTEMERIKLEIASSQGSESDLSEELEELHVELAELSRDLAQLQLDYSQDRTDIDKDNYDEMRKLDTKYEEQRQELMKEIEKIKKSIVKQESSYTITIPNTPDVNAPKSTGITPPVITEDAKYLARLCKLQDGVNKSSTFTLDKPTRVRIYATGEGINGAMYDYGWIESESTNNVVWEMSYSKTKYAGGAEKNRMIDDTILLDKGTYVVHFITDDSHSYDDWNASAPSDPESWGIAVMVENK